MPIFLVIVIVIVNYPTLGHTMCQSMVDIHSNLRRLRLGEERKKDR